jgi:hypothetical protein
LIFMGFPSVSLDYPAQWALGASAGTRRNSSEGFVICAVSRMLWG